MDLYRIAVFFRARRRRLLIIAALWAAAAVGSYTAIRTWRAVQLGREARAALLAARAEIEATRLEPARAQLRAAQAAFAGAERHLSGLGPVLLAAKTVPVLRVQVRAAETFTKAGSLLAGAGLDLADTAEGLASPPAGGGRASEVLNTLRGVDNSLQRGAGALFEAIGLVAELDGLRLIGPLASARAQFVEVLPEVREQARNAQTGVRALLAFAGGTGQRRYLVLSQNPAEPRPTGGFIGTYGVIAVFDGRISLDRYDSIESWTAVHPEAKIPGQQASPPFRYLSPPEPQTLGNVNAVPDWPVVAQAARELWTRGGEEQVDGVISITPGALRRLLAVTGPVALPDYDEVVSADNLVERLDFHTHGPGALEAARRGRDRKDFVGALAEAVLRAVLQVPSSSFEDLAGAIVSAFDEREAMAWFSDGQIQDTLLERGWDGTLPPVAGDFFFESDFAFATKSGYGFRRVYDHAVKIGRDRSAHVTTRVTIANTRPADPVGLTWITLYGAAGAEIDTALEHLPVGVDTSFGGRPGASWFVEPLPGQPAEVTVAWRAPGLITELQDGTLAYHLWWMRVPDHEGDLVRLSYTLPPGWRWKDGAPPAEFELSRDLVGTWLIERR